jgi:hypothetical protein
MKIESKESFNPITIVLESQEEVDEMFAVFNHVSISNSLKELQSFYKDLIHYSSPNYSKIHIKLDENIAKYH